MQHKVPNDILIPEIAKILNEGHQVLFTPGGVSMRPFIEGGRDAVLLKKADECRVGDILLCRVGGTYVLHRLIAIEGEHLTLMGDGNLQGTEHCTKADIIGKVLEIRSPKGRLKPRTRGWLWRKLLPCRSFLLKVYRHTPRIL